MELILVCLNQICLKNLLYAPNIKVHPHILKLEVKAETNYKTSPWGVLNGPGPNSCQTVCHDFESRDLFLMYPVPNKVNLSFIFGVNLIETFNWCS